MRLQVQSLALFSGLRIRRCHELWCRSQTQLGSHRLAAVAPIRPLAWEPPYAAGVALEKAKRQKKKKNESTKYTLRPGFILLIQSEKREGIFIMNLTDQGSQGGTLSSPVPG